MSCTTPIPCCVRFNCLPAVVCAEPGTRVFAVREYDLEATLTSGQAFRWRGEGQSWQGVIGKRWVRLRAKRKTITVETAQPVRDWVWLTEYLQLECDVSAVLATFPSDPPMQAA